MSFQIRRPRGPQSTAWPSSITRSKFLPKEKSCVWRKRRVSERCDCPSSSFDRLVLRSRVRTKDTPSHRFFYHHNISCQVPFADTLFCCLRFSPLSFSLGSVFAAEIFRIIEAVLRKAQLPLLLTKLIMFTFGGDFLLFSSSFYSAATASRSASLSKSFSWKCGNRAV